MKKIVAAGVLMLGLGCAKTDINTGIWKNGGFVPIEEPLARADDFKMLRIDLVNSGGGLIRVIVKENGIKKQAQFYYDPGAIDPNADYFITVANDSVFAMKLETVKSLELFLKYDCKIEENYKLIVLNPNNTLIASGKVENMKK